MTTHTPTASITPARQTQHPCFGDRCACDTCRAFDAAIAAGRLSADPHSPTYAGLYMFMGYARPRPGYVLGKALFKHVDTREYLP